FPNPLHFPDCYFFIPKIILKFSKGLVEIDAIDPQSVFNEIQNYNSTKYSSTIVKNITIKHRLGKEGYFKAFEHMISHIQRGDIYEVNLCQEFYAENTDINPVEVYQKLNSI